MVHSVDVISETVIVRDSHLNSSTNEQIDDLATMMDRLINADLDHKKCHDIISDRGSVFI